MEGEWSSPVSDWLHRTFSLAYIFFTSSDVFFTSVDLSADRVKSYYVRHKLLHGGVPLYV